MKTKLKKAISGLVCSTTIEILKVALPLSNSLLKSWVTKVTERAFGTSVGLAYEGLAGRTAFCCTTNKH